MICSSEEFWFNGHSSFEFGIVNVNIDNGSILEEPFLANRSMNKERLKYKEKSYFYNIQEDVKTFNLTLAFSNEAVENMKMNKTALRNLAVWLSDKRQYHELWFSEDCEINEYGNYDITRPKRVYFAIVTGESKAHHFGLEEGYISLTFETNSPHCYSSLKGGYIYQVGEEDEDGKCSIINFFNHGDLPIKPEISIVNLRENQPIEIEFKELDQVAKDTDNNNNVDPFRRTLEVPKTDFSKFSTFELSEGKKAHGSFQLLGTVYDGETMDLGDKTYEFDLGDNLPHNKFITDNILVSPDAGKKAHNTLRFQEGNLMDGSTVTIGDQTFEYDWNDIVTPTSVKVDISNYVANAKGILHLNSNLMPDQEIKVGDVTYTMVGGTNELIVKMTDHMLTNGNEANVSVRTDRKTLTQDKVNINTKIPRDISKCLLRNISKNPSDIGIRKMGYINKDFVRTLWDGESDEDYQSELDIDINSRIVLTFDEPLDEHTVNSDTITLRDIEGNKLSLIFDISTNDGGKILGVKSSQPLEYDNNYFLYVSLQVKDIKGNNYKQPRKIKLHTFKKDESKKDSYENVSAVKVFNIFSSKRIDKSTINNSNIYVKDENGNNINIDISIINNGQVLSISPKIKYDYGKKYTLTISSNVKNIDGNSISSIDKVINFTVTNRVNETIIDDGLKLMVRVPIDKPIKIPLLSKINNNSLISNPVRMYDTSNTEIPIYININKDVNNVLDITPVRNLKYNSTYFLYISNSITYETGANIERPLAYKIVTETEDEAKGIENNSQNTQIELNNKNEIQQDYKLVNTDKIFTYNFGLPLDENTVNTSNIWVSDSNGNKADIIVKISSDKSGIQIFPNPIWKSEEHYNVWISPNVKTTTKPRVFAGDSPIDKYKNKGDYENAKEIFEPLGFTIVKTNGFKVKDSKIYDINDNLVNFTKMDIIIGNNGNLTSNDYNSDGTIKDNTIIVCIPNNSFIDTKDALRYYGKDRIETKEKMIKVSKIIKIEPWITQSYKTMDSQILSFSTKNKNEHISVDIDDTIILDNTGVSIIEIPKKIKGMQPNDDIYLYEDISDTIDYTVDRNFLIPTDVPQGAKAYAGRAVDGSTNPLKDDYSNAKEILAGLGYDIIDTTPMTYDDKIKIKFKYGDLVIGGALAGMNPSTDIDEKGNLKTTPAREDNPSDPRPAERITGIPMGISIYPAIRIESGGEDTGRAGTKKAMLDWKTKVEEAKKGESKTNLVTSGITVKYKVPKGANIYGAGYDYVSGLRYLSDMGFNFINVGTMTLEEKKFLPFKKEDIVVGGVQATDVVNKINVTGIGAIDIKGALRLGGIDRYETEAKIKAYAESLKVNSIQAGDIIKVIIKIDTEENINSSSSNNTDLENSKTTRIKDNIKIEYHRVKSIEEMSRNRAYIRFEEDIRTVGFISDIEIEKMYKLYDQRKAEDYLFTAPYQIKIGYELKNTMINIIKAINDTGTPGIEYSLRTFKHPIVLAQKLNENEIELDAIESGSKGNIPVSLIDKFDSLNRFLTPTLEGATNSCIKYSQM